MAELFAKTGNPDQPMFMAKNCWLSANSVDPDQMLQFDTSAHGLHCAQACLFRILEVSMVFWFDYQCI